MKKRDRTRNPGRRPPFRDPRPIVLVVCEGTSEEEYLKLFAAHHKNARIQVRISNERGVPFTLVELAKKLKQESDNKAKKQQDENLAYDSVWCVFDIDEHPRVDEAKEMARSKGIRLAISNPSFELWLILHLRESPGMMGRHDILKELEKLVPGYNKHIEFAKFEPGYPEAVKRSKRLGHQAEIARTPGHNPTTNVYELTELILYGQTAEAAPYQEKKSR